MKYAMRHMYFFEGVPYVIAERKECKRMSRGKWNVMRYLWKRSKRKKKKMYRRYVRISAKNAAGA